MIERQPFLSFANCYAQFANDKKGRLSIRIDTLRYSIRYFPISIADVFTCYLN